MPSIIWVTGVSGFIGSTFALRSIEKKIKVIGFGNRDLESIDLSLGGLTAYFGGGLSGKNLTEALVDFGLPDKIFHFAGGPTVGQSFANPFSDFEKNVTTAACLFDFVRDKSPETPIYISSSAAIFGDNCLSEIPSSAPLNPLSPYGIHKVMMEDMAKMYAHIYDLKICLVRLFSIYGPGLRKQLLWDVCTRLYSGETNIQLGGTGNEIRDWCYVQDVVEYFYHLPEPPQGDILFQNGGTSVGTSVSGILSLIQKNWPVPINYSFSNESRTGNPFSLLSANDAGALGFEWTTSVEQGIKNYIEWFHADGLPEHSKV